MKKLSFLTLILLFLGQLTSANSSSNHQPLPSVMKFSPPAEVYMINEILPTSLYVYVPCANEIVELQGDLHYLSHLTINGNHFVSKDHFNPQGISGVGWTSGDKYQATGVTQYKSSGSFVNGQYTYTYINNFKIIGQGSGNNFLIHENFHITVNANGTVTVYRDNISVECK
jgi:hypothetical protein